MNHQEIVQILNEIEHPAICYSLIKLGIVKDIELEGKKVNVVFAFPFPNIPIADQLIASISIVVRKLDLEFEYETRVMDDLERELFLQMESKAWKG
ncbi:iron-sulfur cluster assembly protein [Ancylomarina longa]|uniref:DUF59 domain-containing protein n=1 Tax=Ancylomarina longa TaxID=2487017 RepID=A0A434AZF7_9BACT|nr:iron-sulfur cluster assembly protein [Ancylomarina longa]RUT80001.1 DUF59 domain-containing protein [Ancylomarina longa]